MKILLVNTYDRGGAANACLRLHEGLQREGVECSILFKTKQKNISNSGIVNPLKIKATTFQKGINKLKRILIELKLLKPTQKITNSFLKTRDPNLVLFSYPTSNYDITESPLYKEADIINLHWVAGLLDYKSFFEKNTKPVVWTLHDINPFSGGGHADDKIIGVNKHGCPIYREFTNREKFEFEKIINYKLKIFRNAKSVHIVSLCNWMSYKVKNSLVFNKFSISLIPNGIDSTIFKPRNKEFSRNILNLSNNKKVVLFVADSIDINYKGYVFLKKALKELENNNLVLVAIGSSREVNEMPYYVKELGVINDERLMSIAYSAADVFVIPSLADNLPNTVLESIMCGTPVIGFPVGGIPDMIQDGVNGLLTKDVSVSSLADSLNLFLNTADQFDSNKIRENAVKKYDQKIQADNYIKLFEGIFENKL